MYDVLLTIYSETYIKGGIKTNEKIYHSKIFKTFEEAQEYMDNEVSKRLKIFKENHHVEAECNITHDRVSISNNSSFHYTCYDYRIESI